MKEFLTNGGLSKLLWIVLTFITGLGAIVIAGIEILSGQGINPYIVNIITGIIAHAFTIGGSVNTSMQLEKHNVLQTTDSGIKP